MKTIPALAKAICKKEGLKKQVNIAQVTEILGVLGEVLMKETFIDDEGEITCEPLNAIYRMGKKRLDLKEKRN